MELEISLLLQFTYSFIIYSGYQTSSQCNIPKCGLNYISSNLKRPLHTVFLSQCWRNKVQLVLYLGAYILACSRQLDSYRLHQCSTTLSHYRSCLLPSVRHMSQDGFPYHLLWLKFEQHAVTNTVDWCEDLKNVYTIKVSSHDMVTESRDLTVLGHDHEHMLLSNHMNLSCF